MERLTPRQLQIVGLRCGPDELSIDEAAYELGISFQTVKNHGTSIIERMECRSFYGVCRIYGESGDRGEIEEIRSTWV